MRAPNVHVLAVIATAAGLFAGLGTPASAADPAPGATATRPCTPADLSLREVGATGGALPAATYALRNGAAAACRVSGLIGVRLFDAQGKPIRLRVGPNSAMPMLLTLAPGDEASFTITYGRTGTSQCVASTRIDVYLPEQSVPLSAPATFTGCAFPSVRISALRLGAPSPAPSPLSMPTSGFVT
jgi:Protein of unknown function (DUF4232)